MKVTVIVPVHNRPQTLPVAVRSVLAQEGAAEIEILIVDDGSTDETPAVIAGLAARHSQIRTLRQPNGGVTAARNAGLRALAPDSAVVTFLDSDDAMPSGRLAADLAILRARPEIEITYGNLTLTDRIDPQTLAPPPEAITREITAIQLSCALMRRSLIARIGPFDEQLRQSEDTDYLLRIFESGTRFVQTTTNCVYYRRHSGNMTKDIATSQRYFALTLLKSIQRRKADPGRVLDKPSFSIEFPRELL